MEYESKHPCLVCKYISPRCPYDCIFSSLWHNLWQPCENYECIYCDSELGCDFANKCGAYIGEGKPNLDFGEDEEDDESKSKGEETGAETILKESEE